MIIIEGTDAVGKTSVINNLVGYNILDRDKNISKLFDFNTSIVDRVNAMKDYFKNNNNYIIFLINNSKEELEKRINSRKKIDEFDKYAYIYNLLYLETYLYMEKNRLLNNRLFMVDCTGLTIEEETQKVKEIIDNLQRSIIRGNKNA